MLSLFFVLCVGLCIVLVFRCKKFLKNTSYKDSSFLYTLSIVVSFIGAVIIGFFICNCVIDLGTSHMINDKIEMYEMECLAIEKELSIMVNNYQDYESETYNQFKIEGDDASTVVSKYPELKADTLAQERIDVYFEYRQKITKLKVEKINLSKAKFLLYFGR